MQKNFFFQNQMPTLDAQQQRIDRHYRLDETQVVTDLIKQLAFTEEDLQANAMLARQLIEKARAKEQQKTGVEALMKHYDLSSHEGIMLMCLAEALLRIPDKETEDLLIKDKLTSAQWERHLGMSESSFVNMATWGLALTGKVLTRHPEKGQFYRTWQGLIRKSGEPVIRQAVREAIKVMSQHFVLGRDITEALKRGQKLQKKGYSFSFDMLGEAAKTQADADKYFKAYEIAIQAIGESKRSKDDIFHGPSISVKLSALHPRYQFSKRETVVPELVSKLKRLALRAKQLDMCLTVDAEESERLEISLEIVKAIFCDPELADWDGLGLAVQAYQKRAYPVIEGLISLARAQQKRIRVRLVKGAYWDTEIKQSQIGGYEGYPVFTRKVSTDISYLACAKLLLSAKDAIYPQFATHNAYSVAAILAMAKAQQHDFFEFQNLQGMGKALHDQIVAADEFNIPCRVYAPVGSHKDLLPYLVRRLLENGANSSFVNQLTDKNVPVESLIENPIEVLQQYPEIPNSKIPLPKNLYGPERQNSPGLDITHHQELQSLSDAVAQYSTEQWQAVPCYHTLTKDTEYAAVINPADSKDIVGKVVEATAEDAKLAFDRAEKAFSAWAALDISQRADYLALIAEQLTQHRAELVVLAIREAGKVLPDALSEIREAIDFCRYYAAQARQHLITQTLPGPTGEQNTLGYTGRGVMVAISPWNFPIAIFTGQVVAALVTGNCVIAKPAEQTPLVAARLIALMHEAGIPNDVLQLLPGQGEIVGAALVSEKRLAGVLFTGSTATAKHIATTLVAKPGPIVPFIAETGGVNAMIVDSTALPEQLIDDVISSAFGSAGQRCSALRLLLLQDEIADPVIAMLQGAMAELTVSDPKYLATDVGPVIDPDAQSMLQTHIERMHREAKLIYACPLTQANPNGFFVAPHAFELSSLSQLEEEIFGPVLHVVRYTRDNLDRIIDEINAMGYGLTFGIESRIDHVVEHIATRVHAGNIYVNRNMIGAVVGVQPFGGQGLSGTGPKAGGPHYLARLCHEKTISINTAAAGGNASLLAEID